MRYCILLFFLIFIETKAQFRLVSILGETYKCYTNLDSLNKYSPECVECLHLRSKGFKNFPMQVLKYKNLKILRLGTGDWMDEPDELNKHQKRKYLKLRKKYSGENFEFRSPLVKQNVFKNIPDEIKELKELKYIEFRNSIISEELLNRLDTLLPTGCIIEPDKFDRQCHFHPETCKDW